MAALDFGRNRFTVTNSGSTSTKAHPRVRMGLFSSMGHFYVNTKPPVLDLMGNITLTYRVKGTRPGRPSHGDMNFGMFGSGRYTQSDYVYVSTFKPRVIIVM